MFDLNSITDTINPVLHLDSPRGRISSRPEFLIAPRKLYEVYDPTKNTWSEPGPIPTCAGPVRCRVYSLVSREKSGGTAYTYRQDREYR